MESAVTPSPSRSSASLRDVEACSPASRATSRAPNGGDRHRGRGPRRPAFEKLLVGRKVKVLLKDVDLIRWRQDLIEDRNRLATLLSRARQVDARPRRQARALAR
jgi:hypothetical protein